MDTSRLIISNEERREVAENGGCENGFKCSECGNMVEDYEGYRVSGEFNYCSKCGARVVADDD